MHDIVGRACRTNMEQLHAYDCHRNVTGPRATENHPHETVSQAWL